MSIHPCPQGRLEALALASMHVRAIVAPEEVRFLAVPAVKVSFGRSGSTVPARLRPRDEAGRFVRYVWLVDALNFDYGVTDMGFDAQWDRYTVRAGVGGDEEPWSHWDEEPDWFEDANAKEDMT